MTTRHNACVVAATAMLLAVSTAHADTIYVDDAACDCCVAHGTPGCSDSSCEAVVCDAFPPCCDVEWDAACVTVATALCDPLCTLPTYCSIQTAIDNAVDTDEIVVAPGTYFEAINFLGKAITLRSSDGADVTTIDGTGFFHVVQCVTGEGPDTVLDGFTLTGGNADGDVFPDTNTGGGMFNSTSNPTVTNCTFSGNTASSSGGGMWNSSSSPTVTNCTFTGNTAGNGGGMWNFSGSSPTVTNCTFSGNTASSGGGMGGFAGIPTVTNCTFSGNTATYGGGMYNSASDSTVTNCTFSGNTASSGGGGMFNSNSDPTVTNCSFSGNTASSSGGGMFNSVGSSPTVSNCTFSGNTAPNGGGMWNFSSSSPTVTNCVMWGDSPGEITGGTPAVSFSDVQGGWPGTGNIDADPLFVDSVNGDHHLLPGSPCIDAGNNNAVPVGVTTDLDGNPRFVDDPDTVDTGLGDPPVVDMGAYEFQGGLPCPWDCEPTPNADVGINDFLAVLAQWGGLGSCDFDGGGVGINDFLDLLAAWGPCP